MRGWAWGLAIASLLAAVPAVAATEPLQIRELADQALDFVPDGWTIVSEAQGDLDGDGRADLVLALDRDPATDASSGDNRPLIIALATPDGRFRRSLIAPRAIRCRQGGGLVGDPFDSMAIVKGALVIRHYGGSRERWATEDTFRLQDGAWLRVRSRTEETDTLDPDKDHVVETDFESAQVSQTDLTADGPVTRTSNRARGALLRLEAFEPGNE